MLHCVVCGVVCCGVLRCDDGVCGVMQCDVVLARAAGVSCGVRSVVCFIVSVLYRAM